MRFWRMQTSRGMTRNWTTMNAVQVSRYCTNVPNQSICSAPFEDSLGLESSPNEKADVQKVLKQILSRSRRHGFFS
jgi:ribosome recycling factor